MSTTVKRNVPKNPGLQPKKTSSIDRREHDSPHETTSYPNPTERDIDGFNSLLKQVELEPNPKISTDVMLRGIAGQIVAWKNDPAKLQEMADKLMQQSIAFADAVTKAA